MAVETQSIMREISAERRAARAATDERVLDALRINGRMSGEQVAVNVLRLYGERGIESTKKLLRRLVREGRAAEVRAARNSPERGRLYYEIAPR